MAATKTLPASWFTSQALYNLELRSVFYKAWYLIGPVTRFTTSNIDTIKQELAGILVTVVHHGDETFTVTNNHGEVLKHFLTPTGLLFTTIHPSAPDFDEWFPDTLLPLLNKHDFRRLPHRKSIKYPGAFNWKTMVDGYQECLHCQYTHRSFSVKYPPTFYEVWNSGTVSQHIADPKKPDDGLFLFFFPICTLNLYGGGMSSFRVCPGNAMELDGWEASQSAEVDGGKMYATRYADSSVDALMNGSPTRTIDNTNDTSFVGKVGQTRMEFDYYFSPSHPDHSPEAIQEFQEYFSFVRRVAMEDYELCETAQRNLERGVYSQGVLNAGKENGVLHYQQLTRKLVGEKWREELDEKKRDRRGLLVVGGRGGGEGSLQVGGEVAASA
jgi:phenylpropionate dioxygenase-like ring-hydroxylating dioxygenase large terminal subunit